MLLVLLMVVSRTGADWCSGEFTCPASALVGRHQGVHTWPDCRDLCQENTQAAATHLSKAGYFNLLVHVEMETGWLVVHCLHPLDGGLAGALGAVLALLCLRPPAGVRPVPVGHRWVGHCFVTVNQGVWQSARPAPPPCPPPPPRTRPPGQSAQSPPALVATAPPCRTPVCTGPVSPRSGPPRSGTYDTLDLL